MDDTFYIRRKFVIEEMPKAHYLMKEWPALKYFDEVKTFYRCSSDFTRV